MAYTTSSPGRIPALLLGTAGQLIALVGVLMFFLIAGDWLQRVYVSVGMALSGVFLWGFSELIRIVGRICELAEERSLR